MIEKLDHIGIAVADIEKVRPFFTDVLQGVVTFEGSVEPMKLQICKIRAGGVIVELVQPLPGEESVTRFLAKRGQGLHHICFGVGDLAAAQRELAGRGYVAIWDTPRVGAGGRLVNFLHPKDTHGVLIEIVQLS